MFDIIEETDLVDPYQLHQYVTVRYGDKARWTRKGRRLIIRRNTASEGTVSVPVPPVNVGDIVSFWAQTIPHTKCKYDGKNKRVCLRTNAERALWLKDQGDLHGFAFTRLPSMTTTETPNPWSSKPFLTTLFEGTLQVVDADKFKAMLLNGLGSVKMGGNLMVITNIE